jgi:transposase InsO family protein
MPWKGQSIVDQREEFVRLAVKLGNVRLACRRSDVSPTTGYKWLERYRTGGREGLEDQPRRPIRSPRRSGEEIERAVVDLRSEHPAWGARKIRFRLLALGTQGVPTTSTVHAILQRRGLIDPTESGKHRAWQRFEHEAPNRLWQMDFKGHFPVDRGRCHPFTVLDDHSRYAVGLQACADETGKTVQDRLSAIFRRYGLPDRMSMDNGAPWGGHHEFSAISVWLIRLGVTVSHSRPYHPQTQGKDERFHRTLQREVLSRYSFHDLTQVQQRFDRWRDTYNLERPHESLSMQPPVSRYRPSLRSFPESLPQIEYDSADLVRKVQNGGELWFRGQAFKVSRSLVGQHVAVRPSAQDGSFDLFFAHQKISQIDLNPLPQPLPQP